MGFNPFGRGLGDQQDPHAAAMLWYAAARANEVGSRGPMGGAMAPAKDPAAKGKPRSSTKQLMEAWKAFHPKAPKTPSQSGIPGLGQTGGAPPPKPDPKKPPSNLQSMMDAQGQAQPPQPNPYSKEAQQMYQSMSGPYGPQAQQLYQAQHNPSRSGQDVFSQVVKDEGVSQQDAQNVWKAMMRESNGRNVMQDASTKDVNSGVDPAMGPLQIIGKTFAAHADPGWDRNDPYYSMRAAIRYARGRYGPGWSARMAASGY